MACNQALQLIGLGPCLLLISFLILTLKQPLRAMVPLLFLVSLSAGFVSALEAFLPLMTPSWMVGLLLVESVLPAAAFLLIVQFLKDRTPSPLYWLILCLPLAGSGLLYYVSAMAGGEVCIGSHSGKLRCFDYRQILSLYHVVSGGLILLLVMPEIAARNAFEAEHSRYQQDRFWLVMSLVLLTVALLAIELFALSYQGEHQAVLLLLLVRTVLRLVFVFVMFASLFRTFSGQFALAMDRLPTAKRLLSDADEAAAKRLNDLLETQHCYREMGLGRTELALRLAMSESVLSHVINRSFDCNLSTLLNRYRIAEAKQRLRDEPETPVTTIAFEVGFNSIPSFNRVFKEMTGLSPSGWRERAMGKPAA